MKITTWANSDPKNPHHIVATVIAWDYRTEPLPDVRADSIRSIVLEPWEIEWLCQMEEGKELAIFSYGGHGTSSIRDDEITATWVRITRWYGKRKPPQAWEYNVFSLNLGRLDAAMTSLDNAGGAGWELVAVTTINAGTVVAFFKRPVVQAP